MSNRIRQAWDTLHRIPGGKRAFSALIGRMAPYTGTIDGRVVALDQGYARVQMHDRKAVRNHLDSIHAIALMNLAELCTGLALMYGIPDDARGILAGLSIDYLKKGRGTLTAECRTEVPSSTERREMEVIGEIRDEQGELVARATARWLVGPKKK